MARPPVLDAARVMPRSSNRDESLGDAGSSPGPQEGNLRRGQAVGLIDEIAKDALQGQSLGGEGAGGFDAAGVFVPQRVKARCGLVSIVTVALV